MQGGAARKKMRENALCAIDSRSCKGKNAIFTLCLGVGTPFFDSGESLDACYIQQKVCREMVPTLRNRMSLPRRVFDYSSRNCPDLLLPDCVALRYLSLIDQRVVPSFSRPLLLCLQILGAHSVLVCSEDASGPAEVVLGWIK